ncbi:MAG: hypothetical protein K6D59_10525 [Bacteroidales bacterium]|nr:hypothetical protein [Bacteroidales bacterium]
MKKYFLSILLFLGAAVPAFADSPLTSTEWWQHYTSNAVIIEANSQGCTDKVMDLICDDTQPLELRLAAVNAIGWKFEGQNNYQRCLNHFTKKHNTTIDKVDEYFTPESYCVFAYLMALDNYFEVDNALEMATHAQQLKPTSKGIALIRALIAAQQLLSGNWCELYRTVAIVTYDKSLEKDVSEVMVEEIMDYIKDYLGYCH